MCQKIESLTYVLQACFKGGCRGGGVRLPSFRQISYSFSSRGGGAHYPHQVLLAPPDFQTLRHACIRVCKVVADHNGLLTQGRYIYLFDMNYFKLLLTWQNLGSFLVIKCLKNWSFQKMSTIKNMLLRWYSSMKRNRKIWII